MDEDFSTVDLRDGEVAECRGGVTRRIVASSKPEFSRLQVEMLARSASGDSVKVAAWNLKVGYTIGWGALDRARRKLGARSIAQAVAIAMQCGYISEPTGAKLESIPLMWASR